MTKRMILAITMVEFASGKRGGYVPYMLLNEIKTMSSQLAKRCMILLFSIIALFPLLVHFLPPKYLLCEKYTANIRQSPRKVTTLQVVRTSFLGPGPRLFPPWFVCIYERI